MIFLEKSVDRHSRLTCNACDYVMPVHVFIGCSNLMLGVLYTYYRTTVRIVGIG